MPQGAECPDFPQPSGFQRIVLVSKKVYKFLFSRTLQRRKLCPMQEKLYQT